MMILDLKHGKVAVQFVAGDLAAVFGPFLALVAEEEVEDVLAECLGDQFADETGERLERPEW